MKLKFLRYKKLYNKLIKLYVEYGQQNDELYDMLARQESSTIPSLSVLIVLNSQRIKGVTLEQVVFILYAYRNYDMVINELFPLIDKVDASYLTELLNNYPDLLSSEEYSKYEDKLLRLNLAFDKLVITGEFNYNENV